MIITITTSLLCFSHIYIYIFSPTILGVSVCSIDTKRGAEHLHTLLCQSSTQIFDWSKLLNKLQICYKQMTSVLLMEIPFVYFGIFLSCNWIFDSCMKSVFTCCSYYYAHRWLTGLRLIHTIRVWMKLHMRRAWMLPCVPCVGLVVK